MPLPVALKEAIDALDIAGDTVKAYINRKTGEVVEILAEEEWAHESDGPTDDWPDWQKEQWQEARRVLDSEDFIPLPSQFQIHEWSIMQRFAQSLENKNKRDDLLDAIRGRGAFGRFQRMAGRLGLLDEWHKFRHDAYAEIAIDFLE